MAGRAERLVGIPLDELVLEGMLAVPEGAPGTVLFAHGSGSSRRSPRNNYVAGVLRDRGLGTLLMDLLTEEEAADRSLVFHIGLLARRLVGAVDWLEGEPETKGLRIGLFGASTGAAAALRAAAERPSEVAAVVSRGGRPDLTGPPLSEVRAPTLLIVGGADVPVIGMNREALAEMHCEKELVIVPGASHLFEEPGTLEEVARLAADWFERRLVP